MKWTGAIACILVGFDCAQQATGTLPQFLFSQGALWIWWIVAALWWMSALRFIFSE